MNMTSIDGFVRSKAFELLSFFMKRAWHSNNRTYSTIKNFRRNISEIETATCVCVPQATVCLSSLLLTTSYFVAAWMT